MLEGCEILLSSKCSLHTYQNDDLKNHTDLLQYVIILHLKYHTELCTIKNYIIIYNKTLLPILRKFVFTSRLVKLL